ncbi:MAG: glycoside hydrolase family 88 protein [Ignavibacteriae bacterium]|nr:glycoside hydrolase family 88 protein [Ignavibacteriota bacterium]
MYEFTGDESFHAHARKWTGELKDQQLNTKTHDVGFIMFCSFGNEYRLHPNEETKNILLQSACSLASRFNARTGCIRSWDNPKWQFPVIIDNMMNLELLFWAAKNGGGKELYDIAVSHAEKTSQNHFRPDGSTYHVVSYDTTTGAVLAKETHQGFAHESVWSRGQAWAIYGYTMAYRETREKRFLQTAERAANWFLDHLPDDAVPFWDFQAPEIPREPRDASAAAIAASALFELCTLTEDARLQARYATEARRILTSLCKAPYLAANSASSGILNHTTGNWPAKSEIDVSLIYGDYYFLEAMMRYRQSERVN